MEKYSLTLHEQIHNFRYGYIMRILAWALTLCFLFPVTAKAGGKIKVVYGETTSGPLKKEKQEAQKQRLLEIPAEALAVYNFSPVLTLATA